jgi:hypothetical protein
MQGAEPPADLVVLNGKIVTVDPQSLIVEAAAVRDGRFVAEGANSKVKKLVGDRTRVIDARGKMPRRNSAAKAANVPGRSSSIGKRQAGSDIRKWVVK